MLISLLHLIFVLFWIYTWLYAVQWIAGLCIAVYRLERSPQRKMISPLILPDDVLAHHPVSTIISAYNESACIVDTLEAILQEDYPNLEVILVDDGSSDGMSQKVIDHYRLDFSHAFILSSEKGEKTVRCFQRQLSTGHRLVLLRKENGGKAESLNCGLNFSSGQYCVILDADTKVQSGSLRIMAGQFLSDRKTIVCAGAVSNSNRLDTGLTFFQKCLVLFQTIEYYRTFYLQRILLDKFNANLVVSGAFAMFDSKLLKSIGGYHENTIGEDMELTMRLHAFCKSQHRDYKIAYVPEAKCLTQVPFRYRDFFQQRRRWQIGMIQSMSRHGYMLANHHYGWAGILAGSVFLLYEMFAPFLEILGGCTLITAFLYGILDVFAVAMIMLCYFVLMLVMENLLIAFLKVYEVEPLSLKKQLSLAAISGVEFFTFHIINSVIKITAMLTYRKHGKTWRHIARTYEPLS